MHYALLLVGHRSVTRCNRCLTVSTRTKWKFNFSYLFFLSFSPFSFPPPFFASLQSFRFIPCFFLHFYLLSCPSFPFFVFSSSFPFYFRSCVFAFLSPFTYIPTRRKGAIPRGRRSTPLNEGRSVVVQVPERVCTLASDR